MLNAKVSYFSVANGILVTDRSEEGQMSLESLLAHVHAIDGLPPLSSYASEINGTRGFITVHNEECVLHAYFVDDDQLCATSCIEFELARLSVSGSGAGSPDASERFQGLMSTDSLDEALRLLDNRMSPITHVKTTTRLFD